MRKLKRRNQEPENFQMAPMIDMVFLLLVFFMTVASVAKSQKVVELDLPESDILSVDAEGNFYIGDQIRSLEEVKAAISSSIRANPDLRVQVRADQNTEYEAVRKLLKTAAEAGAYEIIYATYESR
jgi:biopolymer transport protein ExbD